MTTITIKRAFLIEVLNQLDVAQSLLERSQHHAKIAATYEELRAALAAPATAPEKTVQEIMEFARHYAANTFSSATLEDKIRRSLAAPAHQEQLKPGECWPERIMKQWDEMRDLISKGDKSSLPRDWFESLAEMRLIDAPTTAWHDAPTVPGLWMCNYGDLSVATVNQPNIDTFDPAYNTGGRWYGPIPEDKQ